MTQVYEQNLAGKENLSPFHLSIISHSLEESRRFYKDIFGCEERRATPTSVHFDWFGSQLTIHEVAGHEARNLHREVDAEEVPVPHFGAALDETSFHRVARNLAEANWDFTLKPHKRFLDKDWEQWVLFVLDPGGNAIEVKSFTRIPKGRWR